MSESRLSRLRDGLLRLKQETDDRGIKIKISELLDIIDEVDREDSQFAEWCEKHAPNWEPKEPLRLVLLALLANEGEGLSREEANAIIGGEDDANRATASIASVRNFFSRVLRKSLKASGSTVKIKAGKDGVYRTTDPSIITLGKVSPPRDR